MLANLIRDVLPQNANMVTLSSSKKSCIEIDSKKVEFVPNPHPEVIGKQVRMRFEIIDSDTWEWFGGIISSYDGITQKYDVYFPSDKETVFTSLDDDDLEMLDWLHSLSSIYTWPESINYFNSVNSHPSTSVIAVMFNSGMHAVLTYHAVYM